MKLTRSHENSMPVEYDYPLDYSNGVKAISHFKMRMKKADGSYVYSVLEKLNVNAGRTGQLFSIYRSATRLFFQLEHLEEEELRVKVTDSGGRYVFIAELKTRKGLNGFSFCMAGWPGQQYLGKIVNSMGNELKRFSFLHE